MKIRSLWVSKYKNLKEIDLSFGSDLITLLVGQNGLGKSNLIEILTLIFRNLYIFNEKKSFKDEARKGDNFDYRIEYECREIQIKVESVNGQIDIFRKCNETDDYVNISFAEFKRDSELYLPDRVMGYYSGENKRIKKMLEDYLEKEKRVQINAYSKTEKSKRMRKIFFTENYHSQLILFTLIVYSKHEQLKKTIEKILTETLNIETVERCRLLFKSPSFASVSKLRKSDTTLGDYVGLILTGIEVEEENIFWGAKGKINDLLRVLLMYSIDYGKYIVYDSDNQNDEFLEFPMLTLEDTLLQRIFTVFPNPIDFFDALEACVVTGMLDLIEITMKKEGDDNFYSFDALSEGEQQLISVIGLMAILQDSREEVLYLIDEPDTHINPLWQREYVKLINQMIPGTSSKHVFISTHSPLLVQAYEENVDLLLFRKCSDKVIIDTENYAFKNWRIDQVLMSEYFDLSSSRPENIDDFMEKRLKIIQKGYLTDEDKIELKQLENELGFLPTGETILEIESMAIINHVAEKYR